MSVSGVHTGMGSLWYQSAVYAPRHPVSTAPVEPVGKATAVESGSRARVYAPAVQPAQDRLPEIPQGADPVEMAVRGRIQYLDEEDISALRKETSSAEESAEDVKSPSEMMEEQECQTCKDRKYQDGSDDPGVSFKTATKLSPERAAVAVRGHEYEHVVREQAKAEREDRRVVSQSVTLHNEICPECGEVYVAGGETRTVTKADPKAEPQKPEVTAGFHAVA